MLIHLLTPGGLSWTRNGVPKTDAAHDRLMREKRNARPEDLCRGLPPQFEDFLRYCRRLKFAEMPDYRLWIEEFQDLAVESGYPESDAFVWPPPNPTVRMIPDAMLFNNTDMYFFHLLQPTVHVQTHPKPVAKTPAAKADTIEHILQGLVGLHVAERPVLGARNINEAPPPPPPQAIPKPAPKPIQVPKPPVHEDSEEIIVISSGDENSARPEHRLPKAEQLNKLIVRIMHVTDNIALARIITDFSQILQSSRSRTLTKEGFKILDAVYKQLADPSVYIVPIRTSRSRHTQNQNESRENGGPQDARRAKMNKLFTLRREVGSAKDNKTLAKMVAEFGAVIDQSNGRTMTKDAFCFLEGLSSKLRALG